MLVRVAWSVRNVWWGDRVAIFKPSRCLAMPSSSGSGHGHVFWDLWPRISFPWPCICRWMSRTRVLFKFRWPDVDLNYSIHVHNTYQTRLWSLDPEQCLFTLGSVHTLIRHRCELMLVVLAILIFVRKLVKPVCYFSLSLKCEKQLRVRCRACIGTTILEDLLYM